jgi:hypothetical protein
MTLSKKFFILALFSLVSSTCYGFNLNLDIKDINGKAVENMIIYLSPLEGQKTPKTKRQIIISQSEKVFTPYISVTQVGNPLLFTNRDDITHHIYSVSEKNAFAFTLKPGQKVTRAAPSQAAEIAMGCNVHDWMSAHLLVLETAYFTQTNAQGQAQLSISQKGKFLLTLWHPQLLSTDNRQHQPITINTDKMVSIHLSTILSKVPEQKSSADFDFLLDY